MIGAAKIITVQSCKLEINMSFCSARLCSHLGNGTLCLRPFAEYRRRNNYVAKRFVFKILYENDEVAYSELIDENGAQPSPSELDGCRKSGKGWYKKETVVVVSSFGVIASMLRSTKSYKSRHRVRQWTPLPWKVTKGGRWLLYYSLLQL